MSTGRDLRPSETARFILENVLTRTGNMPCDRNNPDDVAAAERFQLMCSNLGVVHCEPKPLPRSRQLTPAELSVLIPGPRRY